MTASRSKYYSSEMKWRAVSGDCRAVTEALDKKGRHSLWASIRFLDALLRGYGQVLLCNNPISGIVIVAALLYVDLQACLWSLCTGALGLSLSIIIRQEVGEIRAGLTTFNCILVGMVSASNFPVFFGRTLAEEPIFIVVVLIGTVICVFLTSALTRLFSQLNGLPSLAVPFASTQGMLFICIAHSALNPMTSSSLAAGSPQVPVAFGSGTNISQLSQPLLPSTIAPVDDSSLAETLTLPDLSFNETTIQGMNGTILEDMGDQDAVLNMGDVRSNKSSINASGSTDFVHKPVAFKADGADEVSLALPPEGKKSAATSNPETSEKNIASNLGFDRQAKVDLLPNPSLAPILGFTPVDPKSMIDTVGDEASSLVDSLIKLAMGKNDGAAKETELSRRKRNSTTVEATATTPEARIVVDWGELFGGVLKAPTQAFGVSSAPGGAVMYFAVVLSSPATAVAMVLGGTVGSLVAAGLVSPPFDALYDGSWTFNSLLSCGVLSGLLFVPSPTAVAVGVVGAIFCVVVIVALNPIVALVPMPYMSIPFNIVTLLLLCVVTPGDSDALVRPENPSYPEENYRHLRRSRRQRNRILGQQAGKSEETEKLAPLAQPEQFVESV